MRMHRRDWLTVTGGGLLVGGMGSDPLGQAGSLAAGKPPLTITGLTVTPIALPDPPLLASSGCHGPYFLRNVIELKTEGGIVGIGEMPGGEGVTSGLQKAKDLIVGQNALAYRKSARELQRLGMAVYAGIEMACLDAASRATGRRLCEMIGGPVRESVEFAAYLFYRFAADHPVILADPHLADSRGRGEQALDAWGEVRSAESMAAMAAQFRDRWGFRVFKLKGGVLAPEVERDSLIAMSERLGPNARLRIDPNARWKTATAIRIGKEIAKLPMEYYEDPVQGQAAMAEVRRATGLKMSTNMCVTRFEHIPEAMRAASDRRLTLRPPLLRRFRRLPGPGTHRPGCRLDAQPAQQQSRRHHHGGDDPPGRLDPGTDPRQRHPLSLARRGFRHHRGSETHDSKRRDACTNRPRTGGHPRS